MDRVVRLILYMCSGCPGGDLSILHLFKQNVYVIFKQISNDLDPPKCFHILLDESLSHLISETQTAPMASFQWIKSDIISEQILALPEPQLCTAEQTWAWTAMVSLENISVSFSFCAPH